MRVMYATRQNGYLYADEYYVMFAPVAYRTGYHLDHHMYPGSSEGPIVSTGYHDTSKGILYASRVLYTTHSQHGNMRTTEMMSRELSFVLKSTYEGAVYTHLFHALHSSHLEIVVVQR